MDLSKLIHVFIKCYTYFSLCADLNQIEVWFQSLLKILLLFFNSTNSFSFAIFIWTSLSFAAIHDRFHKLKVVIKTNLWQVLCHSYALRQQILLIVLHFSSLDYTRAGQYTLLILLYFAFFEAGATVAHFCHGHILPLVM